MSKTALITGITGQDGAYLAEFLLKKGYMVHGIKRRSSLLNTDRIDHLYQDPHTEQRNLFLHYGDLSDSMNVTRIIQECRPDEIYNLGAMSHVKVSFDVPEYTANTDGIGTLRILEAIRLLGLKDITRFYQASTSELYGLVREVPQTENTPFYPRSPYSVAKLYAYWITVNYREAYGLHASNGILFNHESPIRGETFVSRKITHTGLVGSAITRCLKEAGYDNLIFRNINEVDLTCQQAVEEFFSAEKPEYVFLAAAMVGGIVANNTYRADFIYVNLMIQRNVIHACWKHGVKKLLFLGSTCIYPKNAPQPLKEEYLLSSKLEYANEPYAIAKIAGLKTCEAFNIQYGTDFIAVMPTNLYGSCDNYNLEKSHVLPALMRKIHLGKCLEDDNWDAIRRDLKKNPVEGVNENSAKDDIIEVLRKFGVEVKDKAEAESGREVEGEKKRGGEEGRGRKEDGEKGRKGEKKVTVSVWGTGLPSREFMYSGDMARACIYLMEKVNARDILKLHMEGKGSDYSAPHFINIGTGEEITIKDLAYKIKELIGFRGEIVFDDFKPDGTMRKATDTTILKQLGFKHRFDLDAGLAVTYEKYRSS